MVTRLDPRTPERMCIGCRERATTRELLRVVAGNDADTGLGPRVVPDPDRTAPGRGAHLHPRRECFELATRRRAFDRALRHPRSGAQGSSGPLSVASLEEYLASTDRDRDRNRSSSS